MVASGKARDRCCKLTGQCWEHNGSTSGKSPGCVWDPTGLRWVYFWAPKWTRNGLKNRARIWSRNGTPNGPQMGSQKGSQRTPVGGLLGTPFGRPPGAPTSLQLQGNGPIRVWPVYGQCMASVWPVYGQRCSWDAWETLKNHIAAPHGELT